MSQATGIPTQSIGSTWNIIKHLPPTIDQSQFTLHWLNLAISHSCACSARNLGIIRLTDDVFENRQAGCDDDLAGYISNQKGQAGDYRDIERIVVPVVFVLI